MAEPADGMFRPGGNIAVKVPSAFYQQTVAFYRDVVGLAHVASHDRTEVFAFGETRLWIDDVAHATHAEVWLEIVTDDVDDGAARLEAAGGVVVDQIEPLGDLDGHWIRDPAGTILLLSRSPVE